MAKVRDWTERYRDRWKWDRITWGSNAVDCYPGGCPFRVYVRDGRIFREEQSGTLPVIQPGVPDTNDNPPYHQLRAGKGGYRI